MSIREFCGELVAAAPAGALDVTPGSAALAERERFNAEIRERLQAAAYAQARWQTMGAQAGNVKWWG